MFGEIDPSRRWVDGAVLSSRLDAGREREAGDGEADQLALSAAEAADGITHEKYLGEVVAAQCGATECLAGTELALNGDAVARVQPKVRGVAVRGGRVLFPSAGTVEFILKFHLQCFLFSGRDGRSNSFSAVRCGVPGLRGVRMAWTAVRAVGFERRVWRSRRSFWSLRRWRVSTFGAALSMARASWGSFCFNSALKTCRAPGMV